MPSLVNTAAAWLGSRLKGSATHRIAGQTVNYKRGLTMSDDIIGWVRKTEFQMLGDDNFQVTATNYDWSFVASELVVSGTVIEPRQGDRIHADGGDKYEVLALPGLPVSEKDATGTLITVHTKRISEA